MSLCIHRKPGVINRDVMMCGEKIGRCPWYRAAWCIPWDALKALFKAIGNMLLRLED